MKLDWYNSPPDLCAISRANRGRVINKSGSGELRIIGYRKPNNIPITYWSSNKLTPNEREDHRYEQSFVWFFKEHGAGNYAYVIELRLYLIEAGRINKKPAGKKPTNRIKLNDLNARSQ